MPRILAEAFAAHNEELFLIGGSVRDRLLEQESHDLDFATSARPAAISAILATLGLTRPFSVGEKFGTIGLNVGEESVEITTYRSAEMYTAGSRKPEVQFGRALLEDLSRRDFTINAMAQNPFTNEFIDLLQGRADLESEIVRAVGNPAERFDEDPLRLLRAVRFAARLGFRIEPETWIAILRCAPQLRRISRERVRDEYSRMLSDPHPVRALTLLRDSTLLEQSAPMLLELTRMPDHGPRHPLSLWDHVMRVLNAVPPRLELRWAALLHDIAKPRTRTHEPDGRPRFFHHEEEGAAMARELLTDLRYPKAFVETVALLVDTHMQLHGYTPEWTDGAIRRLVLRLGPHFQNALDLARADGAGHGTTGTSENAPKLAELQRRVEQLDMNARSAPVSPLSGDVLMQRYNRPPGPWIRSIKLALEQEIIEGDLYPDDTERAWQIADALIANGA